MLNIEISINVKQSMGSSVVFVNDHSSFASAVFSSLLNKKYIVASFLKNIKLAVPCDYYRRFVGVISVGYENEVNVSFRLKTEVKVFAFIPFHSDFRNILRTVNGQTNVTRES